MMNLKKVLDKMPQYLLLLKLAFSCQIRTLHLMVLELEQCCCSEQKINQVAMIKSAVIVIQFLLSVPYPSDKQTEYRCGGHHRSQQNQFHAGFARHFFVP